MENEILKKALVIAALPLHALKMSGSEKFHCPEVRQAIDEGIVAIHNALSSESPEMSVAQLVRQARVEALREAHARVTLHMLFGGSSEWSEGHNVAINKARDAITALIGDDG